VFRIATAHSAAGDAEDAYSHSDMEAVTVLISSNRPTFRAHSECEYWLVISTTLQGLIVLRVRFQRDLGYSALKKLGRRWSTPWRSAVL